MTPAVFLPFSEPDTPARGPIFVMPVKNARMRGALSGRG